MVDVLDIVHIGYGLGPGFGFDLHLTRYGRLDAVAGVDVGIAWLGRHTNPFQCTMHARAGVSVFQAQTPDCSQGDAWCWRFPRWDFGIYAHALLDHVYVAIAPDEIIDFVAGLITFDLKGDDFGSHVSPPPETQQEPKSN